MSDPTNAPRRTVIRVSGADRAGFLQGLVTNDIARAKDGLVYAALLTPQGKYLADFFVWSEDDALWIDVDSAQAPGLLQRLGMYRLRADVALEATDRPVSAGTGDAPVTAFTDPRHPALGWRDYGGCAPAPTDWDALRVAHTIPAAGVELIPGESYPLEMGFERLNGVDFRKGCYVGQEVTARMKHKTELKKGLAKVSVSAAAPIGSEIVAGDKPAGTLYTQAGGEGLAYLRFDRSTGEMTAGGARVTRL